MKKFALMITSAAALLAVPAIAQQPRERPNPDSNGDGVVTRAEVSADVAKRFARMDVNKDGKLDPSDRAAAMAARGGEAGAEKRGGGKRGERRGGQGGPGGERGPMRADANGDGAVTLAEMQAAALNRFDRVDADKDGKLTEAERAAMRGRMGRRGPGNGNPPPEG